MAGLQPASMAGQASVREQEIAECRVGEISHEMGHLYGLLAHSRRCVDATSYYHDGKGQTCHVRDERSRKTVVEYRATLPTACDIQRCRMANGLLK